MINMIIMFAPMVFIAFFVFTLILLNVVNRLYMSLKANSSEEWERLGEPYCKISLLLELEKLKIPVKAIIPNLYLDF